MEKMNLNENWFNVFDESGVCFGKENWLKSRERYGIEVNEKLKEKMVNILEVSDIEGWSYYYLEVNEEINEEFILEVFDISMMDLEEFERVNNNCLIYKFKIIF